MDYTSNLKNELEQIDHSIAGYKEAIKKGEALTALRGNPFFTTIITDGYIEVEAIELFKTLLDPNGTGPHTEEEIRRKLDGIVTIKGYLARVELEAKTAVDKVLIEEQYRAQITAQYAEDGE